VLAPLRFAVLICAVLAACGDGVVQDNECLVSSLQYGETLMPDSVTSVARDLPARTGKVRVLETCSQQRRIFETRRGIPASVAVFPAFPYERGNVRVHMYVAEDTLVALRDHPLHRYLFGSADRPDLTSGRRCRPVALTAKVVNVGGNGLLIDPDKPAVRVEARTVVDGPVVDGVPRIPKGATVRIQALRCKGRRGLVARRVTVT
jgi:hypothetical protein